MTKMDGTDATDVAQESLTVEEIFSDTLIKRKKTNYEDYISIEEQDAGVKFDNNNEFKVNDRRDDANRKSAKASNSDGSDASDKAIDGDITRTIRLELRHARDCIIEYKMDGADGKNGGSVLNSTVSLGNGDLNEYSLKHDLRLTGGEKDVGEAVAQRGNGEYLNGHDTQDARALLDIKRQAMEARDYLRVSANAMSDISVVVNGGLSSAEDPQVDESGTDSSMSVS
ncbi:unnamed protein product, partial [Iphiclides podalirius]